MISVKYDENDDDDDDDDVDDDVGRRATAAECGRLHRLLAAVRARVHGVVVFARWRQRGRCAQPRPGSRRRGRGTSVSGRVHRGN